MRFRPVPTLLASLALLSCKDIEQYSTHEGEAYRGQIVDACFMRRGFAVGTELCLTFDATHVGDGPGILATSDHLLEGAPLRVAPELLHDPLSTLSFGEGRDRNLVYTVSPRPNDPANEADATRSTSDVMVVLSLMHGDSAEVRLLRGAPPSGAASCPDSGEALFGVFAPLTKQPGPCSF
jgi:hypothetical protein